MAQRTTSRSGAGRRTDSRQRPAGRLTPGATRSALLVAALHEFASRGIAGTPISRLTEKAGARNPSALHYHFGSKAGLIEQLVELVQDWFDRAREAPLAELESRLAADDAPALREVLQVFVRPYARIIQEETWGLAAIRFIATIEFEQEEHGWEALNRRASPVALRFLQLILATTPLEDHEQARRRALFFIDSVIQGFATHRHLEVSFFGDLRSRSIDALAAFYVDCGERLLGHP